MDTEFDAWSAARSYEHYMGRWSRAIAAKFLAWLDAPAGADWLEIGCGTGALTGAILARGAPRTILATDPSDDFLHHAEAALADPRVRFEQAAAGRLPVAEASADVVASALVLNFVPERDAALAEMRRVLRPGGRLAVYVWDYPGGGMGFIDAFWRTAARIDPRAAELDEARRFPFCTPAGLAALCDAAGFSAVEIAPIEIHTVFADLEAFWHPFTLGAGPAPGYCRSLGEVQRAALKAALAEDFGAARPISLPARAWAARARVGR